MKIIEKFEETLNTLETTSGKAVSDIVSLVKQHKKILLTAFVVYFIFNYLFSDEK